MPLSWNEIRDRATAFGHDWADSADERADGQQARVPVASPTLVHDWAREHGVEIEGFLAHGQEKVAPPVHQLGPVAGNEPQQVGFGAGRNRGLFGGVRGFGGDSLGRRA